jgi:ubiquinone/menaquinone biosynthesis C-methylase UbiE
MREILRNLPPTAIVLGLGCAEGSFPLKATPATVIRVDRDQPPNPAQRTNFVQADAARLPFPDQRFAAVISNHSLEHFDDLNAALNEIGRVIAKDGALFCSRTRRHNPDRQAIQMAGQRRRTRQRLHLRQ